MQTSKLLKLSKSEKNRFLSKGSLGVFPTQTPQMVHMTFVHHYLRFIQAKNSIGPPCTLHFKLSIYVTWPFSKLHTFELIFLCHSVIYQLCGVCASRYSMVEGSNHDMSSNPSHMNFWPKAPFSQTNLSCSNWTSNRSCKTHLRLLFTPIHDLYQTKVPDSLIFHFSHF